MRCLGFEVEQFIDQCADLCCAVDRCRDAAADLVVDVGVAVGGDGITDLCIDGLRSVDLWSGSEESGSS